MNGQGYKHGNGFVFLYIIFDYSPLSSEASRLGPRVSQIKKTICWGEMNY